jgi:hypothetical protein
MLEKLEFLTLLNWGNIKRSSVLLVTTVVLSFYFPVGELFEKEIQSSTWRGDFYFILYWFYIASLSAILLGFFEVFFLDGSYTNRPYSPKIKELWNILNEEDKALLYKAHLNNGLVKVEKDNKSAKILREFRLFRLVADLPDSTIWKITFFGGKTFIHKFDRLLKENYDKSTTPAKPQ